PRCRPGRALETLNVRGRYLAADMAHGIHYVNAGSPREILLVASSSKHLPAYVTEWAGLPRPRHRVIVVRAEAPIHGDHMGRAGLTSDFGKDVYLLQGPAWRLFENARNAAFEQQAT